jgi:hypothetical protein
MKKKLQITLPMSKRDLKLKSVSKTKKQIAEAINKEVRSCIEHFNEEVGGWKLNKDFIQSQILGSIFGFSIEDEINQAFINENLIVEYNDRGSFVRTKEEYMPIYMNERTGKIHLVENSDDKTYLKRFTTRNGYVEIGRL